MTVPNRQFTFTSSQPAYRHFSPRLSHGSNTACKPPSFLKLETVLAGQNPGSSTVEWPAVWPRLAVTYWDLGSTFWDVLFSCLLILGLHTDSMYRETQSTTLGCTCCRASSQLWRRLLRPFFVRRVSLSNVFIFVLRI